MADGWSCVRVCSGLEETDSAVADGWSCVRVCSGLEETDSAVAGQSTD